ncbi:hypothetical protein A2962_03045 [Candidatus Woesebacteria bacterium RIFCSPLOWO2_01_FULL_39_61]|uniref:Prokaryotic-type class I peptide chain release factors domain-containing protein n=1 Tax=Candidatus Woesebacteria bacterium RIFCSPHIGHO2_02_FULL_39_13 TaxID=1802505 RepID=A0A1F7Z328_9BACT|nr:MAG: hypothetical protein A2692_05925 [Candidatus Woesebacteria bacterium RIFCSPHIGHO2_01_FULL_39_95]OGM33155.1 MAG: hypothetical protein A3D01_04425 [Candidatus Woesebacteria bacterium RIFCSPHIGHO2_02_FULL_39_13]OGM36334.1 MAG: hypothetical protein A3E13_02765 [Candidatus Woesebacteria bacterium RIFCSPHIGHO2_12_FULL_40_20]OGM68396.1 MAG: hypothetical protein A2962_03045 [Candidatus Woesebacteria bacterium RIFCSPLOWO2_01_FULL_39_61]OGM74705.1 MAG: hypothetical protein A3H19_05880 [Candidatus
MSSINPEEFEGYADQIETGGREGKLRRKKHSRSRDLVNRAVAEQDKRIAQENRAREAEEIIKKQLSHFPPLDSDEGIKKAKIYTRWLRDSFDQDYPILSEGDVKFQYTVASVHAGGQKRQKSETAVVAIHIPTLTRARNEDETSREINKDRAFNTLYTPLERHLSLWKDLLKPEDGNSSVIENKVEKILQDLSLEKQKT